MECPECGGELNQIDTYFKGRPERFTGTAGNGLHYPQSSDYKVLGEIYQCPNYEGFLEDDEAYAYLEQLEDTETDWTEVVCNSFVTNGHFYTQNGDLIAGYPC